MVNRVKRQLSKRCIRFENRRVYPDALWTYILGLAKAGVEGLRDKPSVAETDGSQAYGYMQIPLNVTDAEESMSSW